jgi:putative heme-binding domain-containing protein
LIDSTTGKELHRTYPPRNDRATRVEWNLSSTKGREVELEVIDGDNGPSFAWLAITRLDPPAAQVDSFAPSAAHGELLEGLARALLVSAPADLRGQLKAFLPSLPSTSPTPPTSEERSRLEKVIKQRVESFERAHPRIENGKAIFKTHCASCHQVAGEGALLGPQLDGIGARGSARLCEDILDPNRNVDAHFFLTTLTLKNGTSTAGFVRGESGEIILLVDAKGREYRIEKSSITASHTLDYSLMPSTFEHLLGEDEFHDLLGWLLSETKQ